MDCEEDVIKLMHIYDRPTVFGDSVRIERMEENDKFSSDYNTAFTFVSNFYTQPSNHEKNYGMYYVYSLVSYIISVTEMILIRATLLRNPESPWLSHVSQRIISKYCFCTHHLYSKALASILRYLEEFGLEHALQLTKYFVHFSSRTHMLLNGNTLANLEIYRNSTDFTEKGSLFWILNHTRTRFGKRLLRKWVGRPLVDVRWVTQLFHMDFLLICCFIRQLNERINAIDELLTTDNPMKPTVEDLLKHMPDLEKGLSRIHYGLVSNIIIMIDLQVISHFILYSPLQLNCYKCSMRWPRYHIHSAIYSIPKAFNSNLTYWINSLDRFLGYTKMLPHFKEWSMQMLSICQTVKFTCFDPKNVGQKYHVKRR